MFRMLVVSGLMVTMATAAPVAEQMEEGEQTLSRAKRADEQIVFGNHQSKHRLEKKSDFGAPLKLDKNDLDKKSSVEAELAPINDVAPDAEDKEPSASDLPDLPEEEGNALLPVDSQTEALERLMSTTEDELESLPRPDNDLQQLESSGEGEDFPEQQKNNEYYLSDYYNPWGEQFRKKRSAHKNIAPFSAESMNQGPNAAARANPQRFKRDLTQDQIRQLLENVVEDDAAQIFSPETRDWSPGSREEEPGWSQDQLETLMSADDGGRYGQGAEYIPTEEEEEEIAIEEAKARLALVRLLQEEVAEAEVEAEAEQEQEEEAVAEALEAALLDNSIPYQYEREEERDDDLGYIPIVYEGVPGIFIPTQSGSRQIAKRQYLSLVPGMRKRAWYPDGNQERWQALMPNEMKRTTDAYERLYRLAQALNRKRK